MGYYVNNEYPEEEIELRDNPLAVPKFDKCVQTPSLLRSLIACRLSLVVCHLFLGRESLSPSLSLVFAAA